MLEGLRGRNLAHVGCTVGLLAGLTLGLVAAMGVLAVASATSGAVWAVAAWLGLTVVLGAAGYWVGGWATRRLWGRRRDGE
jgi:hypothetical protein